MMRTKSTKPCAKCGRQKWWTTGEEEPPDCTGEVLCPVYNLRAPEVHPCQQCGVHMVPDTKHSNGWLVYHCVEAHCGRGAWWTLKPKEVSNEG